MKPNAKWLATACLLLLLGLALTLTVGQGPSAHQTRRVDLPSLPLADQSSVPSILPAGHERATSFQEDVDPMGFRNEKGI